MKQASLSMLIWLFVLSYGKVQSQGHATNLDISDSQTRIMWDSLNAFNAANQYYEAIPLLHRITQQAKQVGEIEVLAFSFLNLGELRYMKGDLEKAKEYKLLSNELFFKLENWNEYALSLRGLSQIAYNEGDLDLYTKYINEFRQYKDKITDDGVIHNLYFELGRMYFRQSKFDSAYHYRKLFVDNIGERDSFFVNSANIAMVSTLIALDDYDKGMHYAKRALEFANPKKQSLTYARTIGRIGQLEHLRGNYSEAENQIGEAIRIVRESKHGRKLLFEFCPIAAINFLDQKKLTEAKEILALAEPLAQNQSQYLTFNFYLASFELAIISQDIANSKSHYQILNDLWESKPLSQKYRFLKLAANYHSLKGDEKTALTLFEKCSLARDSLTNIQNVKTIQNLEIKYETEKKDLEIAEANTRINLQQNGLTMGGSLLFLLMMLLYFNNRNKKKIAEQNGIISKSLYEKEILLKEIHHRVKNNLQVISSLLSIQSRGIEDGAAKEAIIEGKTRVHSMSLIHQDLYKKDNLTGVRMDRYLGNLTRDLLDTYHVSEGQISLHQEIEPLKLDVDSVIPLGLIVNELMSNALKHAFPEDRNGQIDVKLREENNSLYLQVSDNGVGLDQTQRQDERDSFGHTLIRAFKSKLDAEIDIQSEGGTVISLKINNYKKVV